MSGSNISKIERVCSPKNGAIWVDLLLNKDSGKFFARVGEANVAADTKADAIREIKEKLEKLGQSTWRQVIVITVERRRSDDDDDEDVNSWSDGMPNFGASCVFRYARRELGENPLKKNQTMQRSHPEDFEREVAARRRRAESFEFDRAKKKQRADEAERSMRADRAALRNASPLYRNEERDKEYEIPYTPEAWDGIRRIARTLKETQARLDAFASEATADKLAKLASGDPIKMLPPAVSVGAKRRKRT